MNYKSRPSHSFTPQKLLNYYTAFVSFVIFFLKFFGQAVCITTSQHSLHLTCLVEHQQQQQCSYDERWRLHVHLFADYSIWL